MNGVFLLSLSIVNVYPINVILWQEHGSISLILPPSFLLGELSFTLLIKQTLGVCCLILQALLLTAFLFDSSSFKFVLSLGSFVSLALLLSFFASQGRSLSWDLRFGLRWGVGLGLVLGLGSGNILLEHCDCVSQ